MFGIVFVLVVKFKLNLKVKFCLTVNNRRGYNCCIDQYTKGEHQTLYSDFRIKLSRFYSVI